jgi:uncharacterized protein DUF5677
MAHYSDEDHERFRACALVLLACREAERRVLEKTMLRPVSGSRAYRDLRELGAREPSPPGDVLNVLLESTVGPHLYAAGEHLGALSLLYENEEIHVAPMVLARTVIEHCAHVIWILGSPDATAESRIAKALLDLINGLEQAEQYAKLFRGEGSPEHLARTELTDALRSDAHSMFVPPYDVNIKHRRRPALGDQHLPSHTDIVVQAVELMGSSLDKEQARGTYALLSTSVHATPNEIVELTALSDASDPASVVITRDRRSHEPLVRLVVSFFYSAVSHATSYSGIKTPDHNDLGNLIEKYLPGHFGKGPEPGPFDH